MLLLSEGLFKVNIPFVFNRNVLGIMCSVF